MENTTTVQEQFLTSWLWRKKKQNEEKKNQLEPGPSGPGSEHVCSCGPAGRRRRRALSRRGIHPATAERAMTSQATSCKPRSSFARGDRQHIHRELQVDCTLGRGTRAAAGVHAERLRPRAPITPLHFSICHLRSETLRARPVLPHAPDLRAGSLQLFHHSLSPPVRAPTDPRARRWIPETSGETGGMGFHIHRVAFTESGIPRQLVCAFLPPP